MMAYGGAVVLFDVSPRGAKGLIMRTVSGWSFGFLAIARISIVAGVAIYAASSAGIAQVAREVAADPIGPGDMVQILVSGEESISRVLSGQFRIGPDSTFAYPLLGRVSVQGLDADELARTLNTQLSEQVPIIGIPSVSVAEYAPLFLLGDVLKTGPIPFQPDMTVFKLVLLAGGLARDTDNREARVAAQENVSTLRLEHIGLTVKRDRLLAEVRQKNFETEGLLATLTSAQANVVENQLAIFDANRRALESKKTTYAAQETTYEAEIQSIKDSIVLHDEEVRLLESQEATQQQLVDQGLAPQSRLFEIKRQVSSVRRESLEFRTALFRAEQGRLSVKQEISQAELTAYTSSVQELSDVDAQLSKIELQLRAAEARLEYLSPQGSPPRTALGVGASYNLLRFDGKDYQLQAIDELTYLQRGDIVRVDSIRAHPEAESDVQEGLASVP